MHHCQILQKSRINGRVTPWRVTSHVWPSRNPKGVGGGLDVSDAKLFTWWLYQSPRGQIPGEYRVTRPAAPLWPSTHLLSNIIAEPNRTIHIYSLWSCLNKKHSAYRLMIGTFPICKYLCQPILSSGSCHRSVVPRMWDQHPLRTL